MRPNFDKQNHIFFFGILIPLLSLFPAWLFNKSFGQYLPYWVETLSPVVMYMAIYGIFDKWLWAWPLFSWTGITTFPDIRGRWTGEQVSSYTTEKIPTVLEVHQTFSKLLVRAFYKQSQSVSVMADFLETSNVVYLIYTYDNEPNSLKNGSMQSHKGTVKLEYIRSQKCLRGRYFNSVKNEGDMEVFFKQKKRRFKF